MQKWQMLATPPEQAGARVRKTDECGKGIYAFILFICLFLQHAEKTLIDLTNNISKITIFINSFQIDLMFFFCLT